MEEKEKKTLTDAEKARQEALASDAAKPGEYTSKWQQQLDAAMDKILNREAFSYDLNGDALYRQYKDRAVKNGRLAMMDTMGQAAAMTGGYGSSYAQSAGQQAQKRVLRQLPQEFFQRLAGALLQPVAHDFHAVKEHGNTAHQREHIKNAHTGGYTSISLLLCFHCWVQPHPEQNRIKSFCTCPQGHYTVTYYNRKQGFMNTKSQ